MECRKCTYFEKMKANRMSGGNLIVGFCKLREKHISDETVGLEYCKDRAVIDISDKGSSQNFIEKVLREEGELQEEKTQKEPVSEPAPEDSETVKPSELISSQVSEKRWNMQVQKLIQESPDSENIRKSPDTEEEKEIIRKAVWG